VHVFFSELFLYMLSIGNGPIESVNIILQS
jgi:hypothetical protein